MPDLCALWRARPPRQPWWGSTIRPGDVQRMSAGTGIRHSEFNASATEPVHFLQIWVLPEAAGLRPSYEQIHVPPEAKQGHLHLIGSRQGGMGWSPSIKMSTCMRRS